MLKLLVVKLIGYDLMVGMGEVWFYVLKFYLNIVLIKVVDIFSGMYKWVMNWFY